MAGNSEGELLNLVNQIADLDKKVREIDRQRNEIREKMRLIRARVLLEVAQEKDERGKIVYSNEKLRQAAVTVRLAEADEYQALRSEERALVAEHDGLVNELRRLSEQKEIWMSFLRGVR